jgi:hypothetical protein
MIAILGLLVLVIAGVLAAAGVGANSGGAHPLGSDFTVVGLHLSGLSTGQLFLYGIVVGVAAMLGLSMLLGTFSRRMASRGSRRDLRGSLAQTDALRLDRERLTQQLDDERDLRHAQALDATARAHDAHTAAPAPLDPAGTHPVETVLTPDSDPTTLAEPTASTTTDPPSLLHRISHRVSPRS